MPVRKEEAEYFLDPDYRKEPPRIGNYCVRCQRPFLATDKKLAVTVNWDTIQVKLDDAGSDLIGAKCWKIISTPSRRSPND